MVPLTQRFQSNNGLNNIWKCHLSPLTLDAHDGAVLFGAGGEGNGMMTKPQQKRTLNVTLE